MRKYIILTFLFVFVLYGYTQSQRHGIKRDTIYENNDGHGVWIDGVVVKDGNIAAEYLEVSKEFAEFNLTTGGLTGISNTSLTLVLNNTRVNTDGSVFALSTNEVTINKTGYFKFTFDAYINNSSTSRTEYSFWIERDDGGGYAEEPQTRSATYQRGYDSGMSSSINCLLSVTSGDKFRIRIVRTDGSSTAGYQDNNGTRLIIEEK